MSLTVRDHMVIHLAATPYKYPAVRETHAREQLGYGPAAFWQRLNWLLEDERAEREYPSEVRRLVRLREKRAEART